MIETEYVRFLQTLIDAGTSNDVRKIANLVLIHFDSLAPLSTNQGRRIKKFVELAQAEWTTTTADILPVPQQDKTKTCPIKRLKSISIGPFRGFAKQEDFNLASQLVLIYGPNGTGKSSFCEALEYGLLGNVAEAACKRFRQQDYLKNAHTNTYIAPILIGIDDEGNDIPISANESLYRFCFIEKNRIDSFSRIAAQAPAKQTELISSLFGLDAFTDFVGNFTSGMDGRYIDLEGVKAKQLAEKRSDLAGHHQQLNVTIPEELKSIKAAEADLAKAYRAGYRFDQMTAELNGAVGQTGRIKQLENELQTQLPPKRNETLIGLADLKHSIESNVKELEIQQGELANLSQQVSFKRLYEAVAEIQENSPEQCPACQTPISQSKVNPFILAVSELKKLEHLGILQETVESLMVNITRSLTKLVALIKTCCSYQKEDNPLAEFQLTDEKSPDIDWWKSLFQTSGDNLSFFEHLETQVKLIEVTDNAVDRATTERAQKQIELDQIREYAKRIAALETRTTTALEAKKKAEEVIAKFNADNSELITEAESERSVIAQNKIIKNSYETFVQKLNDYKNELPAQLVADLGQTVVGLYNAFNRYDDENDKLANIRLPLSQNQSLEISFKWDSERFFDALHILSEGHIRCIGLAILIAKNLKEGSPLLIFDDPVNAIDDEHRQAIRETLFLDDYFTEKQLIIAIHGEEFFNRTHQIIGKDAARDAHSYLFSARDHHHVRVDSLNRPKNYVLAARELYKRGEFRDSLMSARRALEQLAEAVWFHYGKHCDKSDQPVSVAKRLPNQPWDLRCLVENLSAKFSKSKAAIPGKTEIISSLRIALGVDARQPPWTYLNKGTHDETDLPEFEENLVDQVITALEAIDKALIESS